MNTVESLFALSEARLNQLQLMAKEHHYGRLIARLSDSEEYQVRKFIMDNSELGYDEFAEASRRWMMSERDNKPKNWLIMQELADVLNYRARCKERGTL